MKPRMHEIRQSFITGRRSIPRPIVLAAVIGTLLGVGVGVIAFVSLRRSGWTRSPPPESKEDTPELVGHRVARAGVVDEPPAASSSDTDDGDGGAGDTEASAQALSHRRAGMAAMGARDFARAAREFALALQSPSPPADTAELLGLAKSLEALAIQKEEARKAAARESEGAELDPGLEGAPPDDLTDLEDTEAPVGVGFVDVTTRPPGLVVRVDGEVRDLTPTRLEVSPGLHEITILSGEQLVLRRRVEVGEGSVYDIEKDARAIVQRAQSAPSEGVRRASTARPIAPAAPTGVARIEKNAPSPASDDGPAGTPPSSTPAPPPDEAALRVLRGAMPRLRQCYERELASNPTLAGAVSVAVTLEGDGRVARAETKRTSLQSDLAVDCILRTIRRLKFARPDPGRNPVRLTVPLLFTPKTASP